MLGILASQVIFPSIRQYISYNRKYPREAYIYRYIDTRE